MDISSFKSLIDNHKLKNMYIFTGEEKGMMNMYIDKLNMPPIRVNSFNDIRAKLSTMTLFNKSSLYIVNNDESILDEFAKDKDTLGKLIKSNMVIFIFDVIDKRKTFFKTHSAKIVEFNKLNIDTLYNLVSKNITISKQLSDILCTRCNLDVNRILMECDKLKSLNIPVTKELLDELITPLPEDVIFDMMKSIVQNKIKLAFEYWEDLKYHNESPIKVISLLYRNIRAIFLVQSYKDLSNEDIAAKTGLTIGQVWHNKELINTFNLSKLIDIMLILHEVEVAIKTGKLSIDNSIDYILLNV